MIVSGKQRRRMCIVITAALLGACVIALGAVGWALSSFRKTTNAKWNAVKVGDTEAMARGLLGAPYRELVVKDAPKDYYIPGYRKREREITNRVLIYLSADMVLYLWIDGDGRVEDRFIGVS